MSTKVVLAVIAALFYPYLLNLMRVQESYKKGIVTILDATGPVRDPIAQFITTFVAIGVFLGGGILIILAFGVKGIIYYFVLLWLGGRLRRITGNPMIGGKIDAMDFDNRMNNWDLKLGNTKDEERDK